MLAVQHLRRRSVPLAQLRCFTSLPIIDIAALVDSSQVGSIQSATGSRVTTSGNSCISLGLSGASSGWYVAAQRVLYQADVCVRLLVQPAEAKYEVAQSLHTACRDIGFFYVKNTGECRSSNTHHRDLLELAKHAARLRD